MRAFGFAVWATLATGFAWYVALLAWLLDPVRGRLADRVLRLWARATLAGSGLRVVIEGREHLAPGTPRVLVANHASWGTPATAAPTRRR